MKKYFSLFIGILVLSGISCTKEFEDKGNVETPAGAGVTFTAEIIAETPQTTEKQSASKVAWNEGSDVVLHWSRNDEVAIYDGVKVLKGVNSAESGAVARFADLDAETAEEYLAWHPYAEGLDFSSTTAISGVIPAVQYADKLSVPMVAKSSSTRLSFKNACGVLAFTLNEPGVTKVVLSGNGSEALAGKVSVNYTGANPSVTAVANTSKRVTLQNSDGSALTTGRKYYIAVLPQTLENGFTLSFAGADFSFDISGENEADLNRSVRLNIGAVRRPAKTGRYVARMDDNYFPVTSFNGKKMSTITFETLLKGDSFSGKDVGINSVFGLEGMWLVRVGDSWYSENQLQNATSNGNWPSSYYAPYLDTNKWYHVAVVWDATTGKRLIYINGELSYEDTSASGQIDFSSYTANDGWNHQVCIGYSYRDSRPFFGCFAEMRVWDRVRTAEQIKANMLSLTEANPAGLVSYWKFDEGTGNTVADASGNGHGVTSNKNLVWELDDPKLGEASSVTPDLLGISLNATSMDVAVNKSKNLSCSLNPSNAVGNVYWESSDNSVAMVDQSGKVTGLSYGTAVITAYCGAFSAKCTVTVKDVEYAPYMRGNYFPVSLSNSSSLSTLTVEWKMKAEKWINDNNNWVSSIFGVEQAGYSYCWLLRIGDLGIGENELQIARSSGGNWTTGVTFNANEWYHVAVTYNTSTGSAKVYVNGSLKAENKSFATSAVNLSSYCYISRSYDDSRYIQGWLSDLRVWNVERTAEQIAANKDNLTGDTTGLMGHWKMDEGSGNTVVDYSGNGNNLTAAYNITWAEK